MMHLSGWISVRDLLIVVNCIVNIMRWPLLWAVLLRQGAVHEVLYNLSTVLLSAVS